MKNNTKPKVRMSKEQFLQSLSKHDEHYIAAQNFGKRKGYESPTLNADRKKAIMENAYAKKVGL